MYYVFIAQIFYKGFQVISHGLSFVRVDDEDAEWRHDELVLAAACVPAG